MPTYNIRHLTRYTYEDIVPVCHNLAHLLPRAAERHEWRFADLDIHPVPAIRTDRLDYYGNRLTLFAIQEPHHELDVTANGQVTITPLPSKPISTIPWEQARELIASNAPNLL